jgi:hypothetical protein
MIAAGACAAGLPVPTVATPTLPQVTLLGSADCPFLDMVSWWAGGGGGGGGGGAYLES